MALIIIFMIYLNINHITTISADLILASPNEAIQKWKDVVTAQVYSTDKNNENALFNYIEVIFDGIKFVSPYADKVLSIAKPMIIPDQEMVELKLINKNLFNLYRKLEKIVKEMKDELKINEYDTHLNKLYNMQALYSRFIENPNTVTLEALNKQGERNEMFELINWLHREIMGQSLNPIIDFMKVDDHYSRFIKWSQLILSNYAQAMLLHGISVQSRSNVSKETLDKTIEKDTELFEKYLIEMRNVFKKFTKNFKQNYLNKLNQKTISKLKLLPKLDDQELANVIHDYVSLEFPFREWFVCVVGNPYYMDNSDGGKFYLDFDDDQAIILIECEKDGNRHVMSLIDIQNIKTLSFEGWSYKNPRGIFISSTLADNSFKYKDEVRNYLADLDDNMFCKYNQWLSENFIFSTNLQPWLPLNTGDFLSWRLKKEYPSQVIYMSQTLLWNKSIKEHPYCHYKYSKRASIIIHKRRVEDLFGYYIQDIEIITIKKDEKSTSF